MCSSKKWIGLQLEGYVIFEFASSSPFNISQDSLIFKQPGCSLLQVAFAHYFLVTVSVIMNDEA